jgi:glutathione S-transferase
VKVWPVGKFPVLRDTTRDRTIPESSIIVEYLEQHYPGRVALLPKDPEQALQVRLQDRFYDLYVHEWMQRIVGDKLRPSGKNDPFGVEQARAQLATSYAILDAQLASQPWAVGADKMCRVSSSAPCVRSVLRRPRMRLGRRAQGG